MANSAVSPVESLRRLKLFENLPEDSLQKLAEVATHYEAPEGAVLVQPNAAGSGLIIVEEGSVVVELPRRKIERGAGECFGELSLLTDRGHNARVRAKTPVKCLAISRSDFKQMLESEPKLAIAMLEILALRLSDSI